MNPAKRLTAKETGQQGELVAGRFLRRHGYRVLYRNFRARSGEEIDLVCRDRRDNVLAFVEVKTRVDDHWAAPQDAVTREKQIRIVRAAKEWLGMLDDPVPSYRFDIVEVLISPRPDIRLIKNAFEGFSDDYR